MVLLVLMSAHLLGSYVYFALRAVAIKREMRAALQAAPAETLEVIRMTLPEYKAAREDEHEVRWHGRMYDVARAERQGDHVVLYALHDEAEDNLLSFLDAILKNSSRDKKPVPGSLMSWLSLKWLPAAWSVDSIEPARLKPTFGYQFMQSEQHTFILSPPPRS